MKNTMCFALIILAAFPASAQKAANPNRPANVDDVVASSADYAARVDGLLREVHSSLQKISSRMEAGELTPEQGRELKLAATRDMISRLDALNAIYDAELDSNDKMNATAGLAAGRNPSADSSAQAAYKANRTVSVEQLKRDSGATAATPSVREIER